MTRALHLCSSLGLFGAEAVILGLAEELRDSPWAPVVGVMENSHNPHTELADEARRRGLPAEVFPCRGRWDAGCARRIRRYLRQRGIGVVHSHGYKSNLYALLAAAGTGVKRVATCHNWTEADARVSWYGRLDRRLLRFFDHVAAVSPEVLARVLAAGVRRDAAEWIQNGVRVERFAGANGSGLRAEFGIPEDAPVIVTVGRLSREKGAGDLLEAARIALVWLPEARFVLVGDGPEREALAERASAPELRGRVAFAGVRDDVAAFYDLADVVAIPSRREGLPLVLLEAMAAGVPVVATRVGAVGAVLEDGRTGLLVPPGDARALADALCRVAGDPALAGALAERARSIVARRYSAASMAGRYAAVYARLLGNGSQPAAGDAPGTDAGDAGQIPGAHSAGEGPTPAPRQRAVPGDASPRRCSASGAAAGTWVGDR